ncbi:hypothetical protein [Blastococcus sp. TF02A-35]|uniref:hypothetical protein n=1 Tax=Blastococcus sp. TF02A-35 TaxID=2559612 RepID=UPI001073BD2B|nr:hypothetical protein [Blastococcus sp. TF02A_35]TFV49464.1 hypothetical protein E4P43_12270 [Blastococcus sp. TF02A_35]
MGEDRPDVWAVDPDGGNLDVLVRDAAEVLLRTGLPLLAQLASPQGAYAALLTRESTSAGLGRPGVQLPGGLGSPRRTEAVRGLAAALGRDPDADLAAAGAGRLPG